MKIPDSGLRTPDFGPWTFLSSLRPLHLRGDFFCRAGGADLRAKARKPMTKLATIGLLCLLPALGRVCPAAEKTQEDKKEEQPIRIDKEKKIIELDGRICLEEGPLELFASA